MSTIVNPTPLDPALFPAILTPLPPPANHFHVFARINGANIELISQAPDGSECILCSKPNTVTAAPNLLGVVDLGVTM
jgi:hypothetical protein